MSTSAIDSLQNALVDTISGVYLKRVRLIWVRLLVLALTVPCMIVSLKVPLPRPQHQALTSILTLALYTGELHDLTYGRGIRKLDVDVDGSSVDVQQSVWEACIIAQAYVPRRGLGHLSDPEPLVSHLREGRCQAGLPWLAAQHHDWCVQTCAPLTAQCAPCAELQHHPTVPDRESVDQHEHNPRADGPLAHALGPEGEDCCLHICPSLYPAFSSARAQCKHLRKS